MVIEFVVLYISVGLLNDAKSKENCLSQLSIASIPVSQDVFVSLLPRFLNITSHFIYDGFELMLFDY